MRIEIVYDEELDLYNVEVNGITVLECLDEIEVGQLTIADIVNLFKEI